MPQYHLVCKSCNESFIGKSSRTKYCDKCKDKMFNKNCIICGKQIYKSGSTCSKKCSTELMKRTNLEKYGTTSSLHNKEISEKVKNTWKEKYGVDHPMKNEEHKSKAIKNGAGWNYNKIKQTNLEKYGTEFIGSSNDIKNKIKKTNLERYGVDSVLKSKEIRNKIELSNLEKYGTKYAPIKNKEQWLNNIKEKVYHNSPIMIERRKRNLEKYGTISPSQLDEVKEKMKRTNLEKYGTTSSLHNKEISEKVKNTWKEKYGVDHPMKNNEFLETLSNSIMNKYGVPYSCMLPQCIEAQGHIISNINKKFSEYLENNYIENELEFKVGKYSYDIHILNTNILLEINPTYTHNSTIGPIFNNKHIKPIDHNYHYNKTLNAIKNGYHCIHIFDWDNKDKIINLIKNKEKIRGRKVELKEITKQEANEFLNNYHIQGSCSGNIINLGLFYNNELIEVTTFGKPRYNDKYEWEWLRLATSNKYQIIGGVGKFWKYFKNKYKPKSVITYIDNSKFSKNNFLKNFDFYLKNYGKPSCHWYNPKTNQHFTNNLLLQLGADKLLGTNYGKPEVCNMNNRDIMIKEGFIEIFDCGQSTYIYEE